jgi:hypothetical protein
MVSAQDLRMELRARAPALGDDKVVERLALLDCFDGHA